MLAKLDHMWENCAAQNCKDFASLIIKKRNDFYVTKITNEEGVLKEEARQEEFLDQTLKNQRLKERKKEFKEKINLLDLTELMPKK